MLAPHKEGSISLLTGYKEKGFKNEVWGAEGNVKSEVNSFMNTETYQANTTVQQAAMSHSSVKLLNKTPLVDKGGKFSNRGMDSTKLTLTSVLNNHALLVPPERAKRERAWKSPLAMKARRDGERKKWGTTDKAQAFDLLQLSREGWFSRALAFRSLYYACGKMVTTRSLLPPLSPKYAAVFVLSRNALTHKKAAWETTSSLPLSLQQILYVMLTGYTRLP